MGEVLLKDGKNCCWEMGRTTVVRWEECCWKMGMSAVGRWGGLLLEDGEDYC